MEEEIILFNFSPSESSFILNNVFFHFRLISEQLNWRRGDFPPLQITRIMNQLEINYQVFHRLFIPFPSPL